MLRVRDGDDGAFTQLLEGYQNRLIGIFFHMLGDQNAAEDLAQEVFMRVYRSRERYKATAKFSTWLFRIANNVASNTRRKAKRAREIPLAPTDPSASGSWVRDRGLTEKSALMPTRLADNRELADVVKRALETLNERQKMAVLLNKFEGMSYADVSASMGLSMEAVKSLLTRARENLRTRLEEYVA